MEKFITVDCPFCGETFDVELDITAGQDQQFTVDCEVCCRPIQCHVRIDAEGHGELEVSAE